jgi:DNA replication protein DnaC
MLPTIVTTNCTTAELVERLGERTVSRLIEMTDAYKITTDDYRLKKG